MGGGRKRRACERGASGRGHVCAVAGTHNRESKGLRFGKAAGKGGKVNGEDSDAPAPRIQQ